MKNDELTKYIKHYLEKDKTGRAIMLSGDWGIGKSYYVKNELEPTLKDDLKIKCVVVSLYGLDTVEDISKNIYLELRVRKFKEKCEGRTAGIVFGKTLLKGLTTRIGVNLSIADKDMKRIYNSIDLSKKLIILEDIERSKIDIIDVMGYVNNLVEQDGAKVLIVANENEIIKEEIINNSKEQSDKDLDWSSFEEKEKEYTVETKEYFKIKEKTISDTLEFEGNLGDAAKEIIISYNNDLLSKFKNEECIKEICDLFEICNSNNLRSFMYACQKTVNIFEKLKEKDDEFIKAIFYGIICFSLRQKAGNIMKGDGGENYSVNLGTEKYPLFKYLKSDEIFNTYIGEIDKTYKDEYIQLREEMVKSLNKNIVVIEDFEYSHEQVQVLVDYVRKNKELLLTSGCFAKKLDIGRIVKMFKECSPKEKQELRRVFILVYRTGNIKSYMSEDYDAIKELLELIKKDYEIEKDRIQRRQYEWFINNLIEILEKLK